MNSQKLYEKMKEKRVPVGEMCRRLEMSRSAFYRKAKGISEFTLSEIQKICEILDLASPVGIFFSEKVS